MTCGTQAPKARLWRAIMLGSREGKIDAAWRRVPEGVLATYPECLAEERFEELMNLCQRL